MDSRASPAAEWVLGTTWLVLAWGVVAFLLKRLRSASKPARRLVAPVLLSSTVYALSVVALLVAARVLPSKVVSLGWISIALAPAIPLAMFLGLTRERLWLRNTQLEADLKASMVDLAASRRRLVETADIERQRIERNLHDGAQQHLVGMRLRLELAAEAIRDEPRCGEHMLAEIGQQMDEALDELRCLAQGVYPPLLPEHGLGEAIRSASRRSPFPGSVEAQGIGRYPADTETAVYFCCLEALQNIAKHAGPHVCGTVRLWEEGQRLHFEVSDEGAGFAQEAVRPGNGLVNMRDRMEAAGGTLTVTSREGHGTAVRGSVPIAPLVQARARVTSAPCCDG